MSCQGIRNKHGFTLIEMMIVVAIIAIIAGIAYNFYTNQIVKSNRSAAQQLLLEIANRQEQYLMDVRQYALGANALTTLNVQIPTCKGCVNDHYTIAVTPNAQTAPPSFTVTATPKNTSIQFRYSEPALSVNNRGVKSPADKW